MGNLKVSKLLLDALGQDNFKQIVNSSISEVILFDEQNDNLTFMTKKALVKLISNHLYKELDIADFDYIPANLLNELNEKYEVRFNSTSLFSESELSVLNFSKIADVKNDIQDTLENTYKSLLDVGYMNTILFKEYLNLNKISNNKVLNVAKNHLLNIFISNKSKYLDNFELIAKNRFENLQKSFIERLIRVFTGELLVDYLIVDLKNIQEFLKGYENIFKDEGTLLIYVNNSNLRLFYKLNIEIRAYELVDSLNYYIRRYKENRFDLSDILDSNFLISEFFKENKGE